MDHGAAQGVPLAAQDILSAAQGVLSAAQGVPLAAQDVLSAVRDLLSSAARDAADQDAARARNLQVVDLLRGLLCRREPLDPAVKSEALVLLASCLYALGWYAYAIEACEQALSMGLAPGSMLVLSVQQTLGLALVATLADALAWSTPSAIEINNLAAKAVCDPPPHTQKKTCRTSDKGFSQK